MDIQLLENEFEELRIRLDDSRAGWARLKARYEMYSDLKAVKLAQAGINFQGSEAHKKSMALTSQSYGEFLDDKFVKDQEYFCAVSEEKAIMARLDVLRSLYSANSKRIQQDI